MTAARSRYSSVAIALHWIIGLLIIGNLIGGLTMDYWLDSPDPAMKQTGYFIIGLHKSIGLTVLALTLVRLAWRLGNPPPPLPSHMTRLEAVLARLTHFTFYVLMLALPLSGWAMVSTGKVVYPTVWFGMFTVPPLPLPKSLGELFAEGHELLAFVMMATLALHIAAAVKHHYLDRDDVLSRVLPFLRRDRA